MNEIWIIGIGQFGLHAVHSLAKEHPNAHLTLVDPIESHLMRASGPNRTLALEDGVAFTDHHLPSSEVKPDWIVPALPVHLAAEWCLKKQESRMRRCDVPDSIDSLVPNAMHGGDGDVYTSHATFRCPETCCEPAELCSVTTEPRKKNMFEILGDIRLPDFEPLIIRSHQLGPGIGGYRPEALFALNKHLDSVSGGVLLGTACRCHGVVTGLRLD
jgi:hypothetical protein